MNRHNKHLSPLRLIVALILAIDSSLVSKESVNALSCNVNLRYRNVNLSLVL